MIDAASAEVYVGLHDRTLAPLQGLTAAQQRGVAVHALLFGENTLTVGEVRHHPQAEDQRYMGEAASSSWWRIGRPP